ncbi:MAG TPA: cell division protein SepF [Firmicutes bacterium]|nr:cell division protein SepF [Bacillota bacterium]HHY97817.1 cell division protein SepF [Bacillota bacterium]
MKGFVDRVLDFMGFGDAGETAESKEETVDEPVETADEDEFLADLPESKSSRKLVSLRSARQARLVISEPKAFDDVQEIANNLKSRRPVIVNVSALGKDVARRILDVASGVTYAIDGAMQRIGDGIFLFTPNNFEVTGEIDDKAEDETPFFSPKPPFRG